MTGQGCFLKLLMPFRSPLHGLSVAAVIKVCENTILALIQCLAKRRRSNNNERNPRIDRPSHLMLLSLPLLGRPITVPTLHSRPTHRNIESPLLHLFLRTHRRSLRQLHHNHYLALLALHLLSSHPRPLHLRFTCNQSFRWKSLFREGKGNHFLQGKNWEGIKRCMADSKTCRFGPRDVDFDAKHLLSVKSIGFS
ncbi:hypothetical protein Bca52824_092372 [Brassica carinata]|uniref:Uncharacterized protein n=1 Tax=Brassica carinata TaxID=52824 RepID=A0A8X7NSU8_BRACI|nr:hypothetical protein Bca52824_092372 [Brassica carinata]